MVRSIIRAVCTCLQEIRCPISAAPFGHLSRLAKPICNLRVIASFSEEGHPHLTRCSAVLAPGRVPRTTTKQKKGIKGGIHTCKHKNREGNTDCLWCCGPGGKEGAFKTASKMHHPGRVARRCEPRRPEVRLAGRDLNEGEYPNNGLDRKTAAASAAAPARVDVGNNVEVLYCAVRQAWGNRLT